MHLYKITNFIYLISYFNVNIPHVISIFNKINTAGADAKFCGVSVNVNGGYAGVQLCGAVTLPYTGTEAPAVGYAALAADGAGGVKVSTKGNNYLVLNVNTAAKTVSFML